MSEPTQPAPQCWSCGNNLPPEHFATFHKRLADGELQQNVLDNMGYIRPCCRRMFLGDPLETRIALGLYISDPTS